jgi:hypothetical protein
MWDDFLFHYMWLLLAGHLAAQLSKLRCKKRIKFPIIDGWKFIPI